MKKIKAFFISTYYWLMCFLRKDCQYSLAKLLAIFSFFLLTYISIYTPRDIYDLLGFICVLLGIRAWEKKKVDGQDTQNQV